MDFVLFFFFVVVGVKSVWVWGEWSVVICVFLVVVFFVVGRI